MNNIYFFIILIAVTLLSCSSDRAQNSTAKAKLPKGNYTLVETTINGKKRQFNASDYTATDNEFLNSANFPDGYTFNLGSTDTITFSREMGQYLFDGVIFLYGVDGTDLVLENTETNTKTSYKLEGDQLTIFTDKGDLEQLIFAFTPFKPGKYDAVGYSIQKSANHQIAHKFLDTGNKRALFDFRKDSTVHIAPAFGIKVFKDSVFDYTVNDKKITFKKGEKRSLKYKNGTYLRLYLNDTIFKRIDLRERKPDNGP